MLVVLAVEAERGGEGGDVGAAYDANRIQASPNNWKNLRGI